MDANEHGFAEGRTGVTQRHGGEHRTTEALDTKEHEFSGEGRLSIFERIGVQNVKSRGCERNGEAGWADCRGQQSLPLGRFIEVNFVCLGMDDLELKRLKGVIAMGCVEK